jgi:uncharacterized membrane protein HdeD (DUF308 family)
MITEILITIISAILIISGFIAILSYFENKNDEGNLE